MQPSTQPYKGTRDFYPADMRIQEWMFSKMRSVTESYGYQSYNGPMLEPFEVYAAKTSEEILNHQLYWLMDRGERKLALRPEMTPTMARMVAGKIHELPRPIRWYSIPNLWRYERPQRGRLREHWQLNVDVLGGDPLLADAEILCLAFDLIKAYGGQDHVVIRVNHRKLVDDFFKLQLRLDAEVSLKAVRLLDARAKIGEENYQKDLVALGLDAGLRDKMEVFFRSSLDEIEKTFLAQGLQSSGLAELKALFGHLHNVGISAKQIVFDPMILRGFDYYTGTVFEMYDTHPENTRAMFGGGRYDRLIGMYGKQELSGVGLGWGDVTLRNFLETHKLLPELPSGIDVLVSLPSPELQAMAAKIANSLREGGLHVMTPLSCDGFGPQLKLATKHGARFAVLLGEQELAQSKVAIKDLAAGTQESISIGSLKQWAAEHRL